MSKRQRRPIAHRASGVTLGIMLGAAAAPAHARADPADCASLSGLSLEDTTITLAQSYPAGPFSPGPGIVPIAVPAFCRIAGSIRPTSDSNIRFELWMPSSTWNGRYSQLGNFGLAGSIPYTIGMRGALIRNFAISGTDDGHTTASIFDASWAPGHPQKVIDFGYRAVHLTAVISEQIVAAYYGQEANYRYFAGCSDGGREAMVETQRYPDDFDGYLVGAPAYAEAGFVAEEIWNQQAINATPASALPTDKLQVLTKAVLAQCDGNDGLVNGYLDNPRRCHFDPGVLQCAAAGGADCLTAAQVTAVRKIYAGPHNPDTGQPIYPGFEKGSESDPGAWPLWITNPDGTGSASIEPVGINNIGAYLVFNNPSWTFRDFSFERDVKTLHRTLDPNLSALNTDLREIRGAGKKIIQYHGWADTGLPPRGSVDYYKAVIARMGDEEGDGRDARHASHGLPPIADFYRLFMAPGMEHCGGGPGPNSFGNQYYLNSVSIDPRHDAVAALVNWVENGVAPDQIIAVKYQDDIVAPGNLLRTRPLCPYPQVEKWSGNGSIDDAANFTCATPPDGDSGPD